MPENWRRSAGPALTMSARDAIRAALVAVLLLVAAAGARGAEFLVDSTVDAIDSAPGDGICSSVAGECTLRAAVIEANQFPGPDSISIPAGVFTLTIEGPPEDDGLSGDLDVLDVVSIQGAGAGSTIIIGVGGGAVISLHGPIFSTNVAAVTIVGELGFSPFREGQPSDAVISDCIIEGGSTGIRFEGPPDSGRLTVLRTSIRNNRVGIRMLPAGEMRVESSQIASNVYGILVPSNSGGGYISAFESVIEGNTIGADINDSQMLVEDSLIRGNRISGITLSNSEVSVYRTTIEGNGTGILMGSGDPSLLVVTDSAVLRNSTGLELGSRSVISNTTVSANSGGSVGGIAKGGFSGDASGIQILNSTIVGNTGADFGGIGAIGGLVPGSFTWTGVQISGSIIAGNFSASGPSDCGQLDQSGSPILLGGGNLIGDSSGCPFTSSGSDQIGTASNPIDPLLGPLASNGGSTWSHALLPGSPALDSGPESCPDTDQRGAHRPFDADGDGIARCDIGAYEASDLDGDGAGDLVDNCTKIANPDQSDADSDALGDACDPCPVYPGDDADGDGLACALDNCPLVANADQADSDDDSVGDGCDNCPTLANTSQSDIDSDAFGDGCDNCPTATNNAQSDADADAVGDVCDNCPATANGPAQAEVPNVGNQVDGTVAWTAGQVLEAATPGSTYWGTGAPPFGDGVGDACDNCPRARNPRVVPALSVWGPASYFAGNPEVMLTGRQRDDDQDGYGNKCDADFTATGALVGSADLTQFRASSGKSRAAMNCGTSGLVPCAIFDLDEGGTLIGSGDLYSYRALTGKAAGPKCPSCPLACEAGALRSCESP